MAVDPKLVVALEARLDKFESKMKEAGVIADREVSKIEERFSKANPTFAPTFLGNFLGNIAGQLGKGAITIVTELINRFRELESVAKLAGTSMQDLFGLQEAAHKAKAPIEDVTQSVRSLAVLIDQMQRGETNTLTRLFDANPEALKGVNRETLTWQRTLEIVADLIQNAKTEVQKIDIAKAAGQAETMVKFLERGAQNLRDTQKAAADAAPDLQKLANLAKDFEEIWKSLGNAFKAGFVDEFNKAKRDLANFLEDIASLLSIFKGPLAREWAEGMSAKLKETAQSLRVIKTEAETPPNREGARSGNLPGTQTGTTTRDPTKPLSNVPVATAAATESKDAFDRATDSINKHISAMQADAATVGLGVAAQQQLRAEMQLLEAARKAGTQVTDEQIATYARLRVTMSEEQALKVAGIKLNEDDAAAFAKVSARINEVATALEKLKDRAPLANFARDAQNLEKQFTQFSLGAFQSFESGFADIVTGTKSVSAAFNDMANSIVRDLIKIAVRQSITGPIAGALFGAGGLTGLFGGAGAVLPGGLPLGQGGIGTPRAGGGPVNAGTAYPVGERGPELFVPRTSGTIVPNNIVRGGLSGAGPMNIQVTNNNNAPVQVSTQAETDGRGGLKITNTIDQMMTTGLRPGSPARRSFGRAQPKSVSA